MAHKLQQPSFVLAALLAGRLYRMLETAQSMSISSSNAKGISIRGGEKTAGFKPITDFISDMAKDTISISSKINATALSFSITAVNEQRALTALANFQKVQTRLQAQEEENSEKVNDIHQLMDPINQQIEKFEVEQKGYCKYLEELFDEITQRIRAARIIVTNSRTEASRAGEYQTNLFSIADDLEYCSQSIADEIKVCKRYLTDLTKMIGQQ